MQYRKFLLSAALLIFFAAAGGHAAVELHNVHAIGLTVYYTVNTTADVVIEIFPADASGNPTGPAVKTVCFTGMTRGEHCYLWIGDKDDGTPAPAGNYAARVTANANQAHWDPIMGLYTNNDPFNEYPPRPLPSVPDVEGFYGIGINKNPDSPCYGRVYASHKTLKAVFMYAPDGGYLGTLHNADGSDFVWASGGAAAPWDLSVADDGYVYVCDRTNMVIYCFSPEGAHVSASPPLTNFRALFARTTPDGRTHVFYSGSAVGIHEIIVEPDHVTWTTPLLAYYAGGGAEAFGMWVSPDLAVIYQACISGGNAGVTRWLRQSGGNYARDSSWSSNIGPAVDVDVNGLGYPAEFLWVTKMAAYGASERAVDKVNVATGARYLAPCDVVTYGLMCCADGVGNVAVTFGKSATTWAQRYWGLFAEAGATTATRTVPIGLPSDFPPAVVPGSAVWTPDNVIGQDGVDSASVTFKVMDGNGWQDIDYCSVVFPSLVPVGMVVDPIQPDPSDPNGYTGIVTVRNINTKPGTRCSTSYGQPPHFGVIALSDNPASMVTDESELVMQVTGHEVSAYVRHRLVPNWMIAGARIRAIGGGVPGTTDPRTAGPFVYESAPADSSGYAAVELHVGTFCVTAEKIGFGSEPPVSISTPYYGGPYQLYLRPLTMAEARSMPSGTLVNVEGVCFAWPQGDPPTAAPGLAPRGDTTCPRKQWYMCDRNDPGNGILCLITGAPYTVAQWDDHVGMDDFGNSTYIGRRPALGDTIMYTGVLDTPSGYERRVMASDSDVLMGLANYTIERWYLNRGDLGGLPSAPVNVTCADVALNGPGIWGKFVRVQAWVTGPGSTAGSYTIADSTGTAELLLDAPASLAINNPPTIGCHYTFTGAAGRTSRFGPNCVRVRCQSDIVLTSGSCEVDELEVIRSAASGTHVQVNGQVTGKWPTFFYIEDLNREIGVRVRGSAPDADVDDIVKVVGTVQIEDGEKVIVADIPAVVTSVAFPCKPYDLAIRDVGGASFDSSNPGVTNGRGALNVGLLVHVQGMVTEVHPSATPEWYYLWDGTNRSDAQVSDGVGYAGIRIESAPPAGVALWREWVDVIGVASTDASLVEGKVTPTIIPTNQSVVTLFGQTVSPSWSQPQAGWNLVSIPDQPAATGDGDEWSAKPWDAYMVFSPNHDPDEIDGLLFRWENCIGGCMIWDPWSEVGGHGPFGGINLSDGYWLQTDATTTLQYSGRNSHNDQWIGVCAPGWLIMGYPNHEDMSLADVKVHAGDRIVSMYDATITNGWIDCFGYWWDENAQGLSDIGIPECWASTDILQPWHGYWIQVYRGDMSIIVPETP